MASSANRSVAASSDPFYVVKGKVEAQLSELRSDYARWQTLLESSNTSASEEFKALHKGLKVSCKKISFELQDLRRVCEIVEGNRAKFPAIDDDELASRQRFINATSDTVQTVRDARSSDRTKRKMESDRERQPSAQQRDAEARASDYVSSRAAQQQELVQQQDVVLDDMASALQRLGAAAGDMNAELETQGNMLNDFDDELDETETTLSMTMKRIEKVLGTSKRWQLWLILFLFVLMCILFFVVVYT